MVSSWSGVVSAPRRLPYGPASQVRPRPQRRCPPQHHRPVTGRDDQLVAFADEQLEQLGPECLGAGRLVRVWCRPLLLLGSQHEFDLSLQLGRGGLPGWERHEVPQLLQLLVWCCRVHVEIPVQVCQGDDQSVPRPTASSPPWLFRWTLSTSASGLFFLFLLLLLVVVFVRFFFFFFFFVDRADIHLFSPAEDHYFMFVHTAETAERCGEHPACRD